MSWTLDTALGAGQPLDAHGSLGFATEIGPHWRSLHGVHGGLVAALCVRAADVLAQQRGPAGATLRAATIAYMRGCEVGPITLEASVLRAGRALLSSDVQVRQGGSLVVAARTHHAPPWPGTARPDLDAAPSPRPDHAVRLLREGVVAHFQNAEAWLHPDTLPFAGGPLAAWIGWARPLPGEGMSAGEGNVDAAWLALLGDFYPPATFAAATEPARAVTIEYAIQVHTSQLPYPLHEGEHVAVRVATAHAIDGFAVEDGVLRAPNGALLATTRQTRLSG